MAEQVTAAQAATLTGLSERTIRRRILSGQIPARRIAANRYAIRVEDLPRVGGAASVFARLDDVETRLRTLEGEVLALRAMVADFTDALSPAAENSTASTLDQLRVLLGQLGHETDRLAPLIGFPQSASAPDQDARQHSDGRRRAQQAR